VFPPEPIIAVYCRYWHAGYKRQLEIYQWLLRQNGFQVSPTAYWVYANGDAAADQFDQTLRFRITVIAYDGRDDWVEPHIMAARECLLNDTPQVANISDPIYASGARNRAAKAGRLAARSREGAERGRYDHDEQEAKGTHRRRLAGGRRGRLSRAHR
jgi:hypothetical protein